MSQVPSPFAWPLIGTMPAVVPYTHNINEFHKHTTQQLGMNYRVWGLGFKPRSAIISHKPENIKHVLTTNFSNYERRSDVPRFEQLFGNGIFNSNGDNWKFHRRTSRPLFTKPSVAEMLPHFVEHGQKAMQFLEDAAKSKQTIDFQDVLFRFTLDSIGTVGFGQDIGSLDKPVPFSQAFNRSQETVSKNGRNPFLRLMPDKQFDADCKQMSEFVLAIVRSRRAQNDYTQRTDLLSRFMSMKDDAGNDFSEEYLRDMVLNFFIAGRDTTACLMAWTFYLLSQNPEVENKLIALIDQELGSELPTYEKLNNKNMEYLRWVLDETLRLYPSVPMEFRRAIDDDVLPDGTIVPGGVAIAWSNYLIGHTGEFSLFSLSVVRSLFLFLSLSPLLCVCISIFIPLAPLCLLQ
eukprot:TRINITY_DN2745_c0_g1_i3.p1 TRINITY_DN2745_c0_g1~~TRINITY_DN2745_c0_g1_i3.p1  ORF type:complete len:450 (-),score=61.61 TRINITY_DN2745_c0_g1_i3:110-1324(-)